MKKVLLPLFLLVFISITGRVLIASGVNSMSHQSAEFYMGLSRNAATDSADCALYNPAGTAFMEDGLFLNIALQGLLTTYRHKYEWTTYRDNSPGFMPSLFLVYKKEQWAGFFTFNVPAGMGQLDYSAGIGLIQNQIEQIPLLAQALAPGVSAFPIPIVDQKFKAFSSVFGLTVGGAYRFNDYVSISLSARYLPAMKSAQVRYSGVIPYNTGGLDPGILALTSSVDYEAAANGFCGIAGIDIKPVKQLTLTVTYASLGMLYYNYTSYKNVAFAGDSRSGQVNSLGIVPAVVTLQLWMQGNSEKKHTRFGIPPVLLAGAEYRITPALWVSSSFAYYFNGQAQWYGVEKKFNDGWELSLALQYAFTPVVTVGIGGAYSGTGISANALGQLSQAVNPAMNNWAISVGTKIRPRTDLDLTIGAVYNPYIPRRGTYQQIRYTRTGYGLAIGIQYKAL